MAHLVSDDTITTAWLASVEYLLHANRREEFNLLVVINNPNPNAINLGVLTTLELLLEKKGLQRVGTVANTIFPESLAQSTGNPHQLYERYEALLPRIRRYPKNRKGTYFERLICYRINSDVAPVNQVDAIIQDLKGQLAGNSPLRFVYEAQVFVPGKDRVRRGFPCLSSLSFQLDKTHLRLTAIYRNQYYIQRALGNFLGLARLQRFVAGQVGLEQGPLTIHASHAELDMISKQEAIQFIETCRQV